MFQTLGPNFKLYFSVHVAEHTNSVSLSEVLLAGITQAHFSHERFLPQSQIGWARMSPPLSFKFSVKKSVAGDFPGGPVVKNLPCNVRDTGLIPGQGTKIPHTMELTLRASTTKPASLNY